jgi:hypothetical protein
MKLNLFSNENGFDHGVMRNRIVHREHYNDGWINHGKRYSNPLRRWADLSAILEAKPCPFCPVALAGS